MWMRTMLEPIHTSLLLTAPGKDKISIGTFGILHPDVLANFDIQYLTSCMDLNLETLM